MRQTSRYYADFAFVAPCDCNECGEYPCEAHLDAESVNELLIFFVGGMANMIAIEERNAILDRQHIANRIAALVLDYADDMYLPPLVPEADYGDLAVLLSLEVL